MSSFKLSLFIQLIQSWNVQARRNQPLTVHLHTLYCSCDLHCMCPGCRSDTEGPWGTNTLQMSHYFNKQRPLGTAREYQFTRPARWVLLVFSAAVSGFSSVVTPLNMSFSVMLCVCVCVCVCVAGFASFPASDSQPKVPRPMSVNPFTVSRNKWNRVHSGGEESWSIFLRAIFNRKCSKVVSSSRGLQGNVYPSRGTSRNPFIWPPSPDVISATHPSISGNRGRSELEESLPFQCLRSIFHP